MSLDLTVTDLFCGAGGSSIGAERAGARLRMAANHWRVAIETHNANFPDADHDCADVSQVEPQRYPATDLLIASPECRTHSQARSRKPKPNLFDQGPHADTVRSRATMWDVPRFAEEHRYQVVVVENVIEIMRWEPIDGWFLAMESLGYRWRILSINSMVAPATERAGRVPQSRDRVYVVFWRDGNRPPELDLRPQCWCPRCEDVVEGVQSWKRPDRRVGRYRQQYLYRCSGCTAVAMPLVSPAAAAIDWALPCPRIGDRARPLADATMRRIRLGLERFGSALIQRSGHTYERPDSDYVRAWPTSGPAPTQTTEPHHGLALVPFMLSQYDYQGGDARRVYGVNEPLRTLVAEGNHHALVVPLHHDARARTTEEPWPTQTGRAEQALVVPMRTNGTALDPDAEPLRSITTSHGGGHHVLLVPLRNNGRARPVDGEPLPTVAAAGNHHGLFVLKNYGDGRDPSNAMPVTSPFGTVTSIDKHSLVALPFLTNYHRTGNPVPVDQPAPTLTTRDRCGLVEPAIDVEDCGFRMLEPHEAGRAMAFPDDYAVGGSKRDRVRQYGNAVTPPVMSWIMDRVIGSLA